MDKLIKYISAAILIAIPLYPKFPLIDIPGTFVSIRLEDLLLLVSFVVLFVYVVKTKNIRKFVNDRVNKPFIIYLTVGLVSVVSAIYISHTANPVIAILHWIRRIEYFVPFFLGVYFILSDKKNLFFLFNILVLVVIAAFIYGFGQKYYYWPIIITQNEEYSKGVALRYVPGGHINSTFAGHYDLGTFLIMALPIFLVLAFSVKDKRYFVWYTLGFLSGLWLLVSSASRISLVSYLLSAIIALILINKKKLIPVVLAVTLLFASTSANLVSRYERIIQVTTQKMQRPNLLNYIVKEADAQTRSILPSKVLNSPTPTPVPVFEDRSSNIRINVEWPRAVRAFEKNPLLGTGYSSITLATDNDYLRLFGETGFLGALSFMLIILTIFSELLKGFPFIKKFDFPESVYLSAISSSIVGVLINAFFIDVFEASKFAILFWFLVGSAIGVLKYKHENIK